MYPLHTPYPTLEFNWWTLKYMTYWNVLCDWTYENFLPANSFLNVTVVGESGISIKKLVPSSQLRARRGSNGKEPKNGTPRSSAILLAPPVFAGNMAVSVCKTQQQTTYLRHTYFQVIHWIFNIYICHGIISEQIFLHSPQGDSDTHHTTGWVL